jgi:phospholipid/cholesterol/gamma-HCH transport system substrate-binding protein
MSRHLSAPRVLERLPGRLAALVVVLALVAGGTLLVRRADDQTVTAYFASSTGIYEGDEVRILGVPVGTVEEIEPTDDGVRIDFRLDSDVKVPADARAAIVAPSLVSSRYLQLAPQYDGGPVLRDGATIPLERTAVPVEFDQIKDELDRLATDFGPTGVNRGGSLSRFIKTGSTVLQGQGSSLNATISELSRAVELLNSGSGDIFATVDRLQSFVSVMATSDQQIREFGQRLDIVSAVLAENRISLARGLRALGVTVRDVHRFVRGNRQRITTTVRGLADVLAVVAGQREAIEQILHVGPNALRNLFGSFHQKENSIAAGLLSANTNNLRQLVCGAIGSTDLGGAEAAKTCAAALGPLLDALSGNVPLSSKLLADLEAVLGLTGAGR